jgi:nitroimidazol reductase NimA-like FMN-containing flavoprotein (pyridoxamine 5'-phosphate oxidase superfamily)
MFAMSLKKQFQTMGNVFMGGILRSPLHILLSSNTLLITFKGRRSGKQYTTPVNYALVDDLIYVTSMKDRTWWRNIRGGAQVTLRLQGKKVTGWGEVIEDVGSSLMTYLRASPNFARYFEVEVDSEGHFVEADVARAARPRVMVKIKQDR